VLALLEPGPEETSEPGSSALRKWSRSQSIRTAAQVPIAVALVETLPAPRYQQIATEAARLSQLGFSRGRIAASLSVTDKTVAKALRWLRSP